MLQQQFPASSVAGAGGECGSERRVGRSGAAEMVLLTMIARVADGLPLAASMQEDEQVGPFVGGGRGRGARVGVSVRSGRGPGLARPSQPPLTS